MSNQVPAIISNEFDLDKDLLPAGSSAKILVAGTKDPAVLKAILSNDPFPEGSIEIGDISLRAKDAKLEFKAGPDSVGFTAAGGAGAAMGIFADCRKALQSLNLGIPAELDLSSDSVSPVRYLAMSCHYEAAGSVSVSHPIGAFASASARVSAKQSGIFGVVHAFPSTAGAHTVVKETMSSWRLPRHVGDDAELKLKPQTWLVAEVDGTLAINLAARLGYKFSLAKDFQFLDKSREIGAKIDAGLKATFGLSATGKYVLIAGRESAAEGDQGVRIRMFRQSKKESVIGIDLTVGLVRKAEIPKHVHDLVKAIFGVHGQQVVKELALVESWADPKKDLSETTIRLVNGTGLNLLTATTGIDAKTEFQAARKKLMHSVTAWNQLPENVSAALWNILSSVDPPDIADFKQALASIAGEDVDHARASLNDLVGKAAVGDSPIGRFLSSAADRGLLTLSAELGAIQSLARKTLDLLNTGVMKKVQEFIDDKLDLSKLLAAVTQGDFDKLDTWLVKRLSDFFGENIQFSNLRPVQTAIHAALGKTGDIYNELYNAANGTYRFQFAAAFAEASTSTALLDASFDLLQPGVRDALKSVLSNSNLDVLLSEPMRGVTLNQGVISHSIKRTTTAEVHMPMFDFQSRHVTDSIAKLTALNDGGRVLLYELDAGSTALVKARYHSQLSALANLQVRNDTLQIAVSDDSLISYEDRLVRRGVSLAQLRHSTDGFASAYLKSATEGGLDGFYAGLQSELAEVLGTTSASLGDALLSMQLSYPAGLLNAWFLERTDSGLIAMSRVLSRKIQAVFRDLLCSYYFREVDRLKNLGASTPLLVWASLPAATSVSGGQDGIELHDRDDKVYWDFQSTSLRRGMIADSRTTVALRERMQSARTVLLAAGEKGLANFYDPKGAPKLQVEAATTGENNLFSLLLTESKIVNGAVNALHDIHSALPQLKHEPSKAIRRFADFGADLTEAFNDKISALYGDDSLRTLGTVLLIEASKVLDPGMTAPVPDAMLSMAFLKSGHKFDARTYIDGKTPPQSDIAFSKAIAVQRPRAAVIGNAP